MSGFIEHGAAAAQKTIFMPQPMLFWLLAYYVCTGNSVLNIDRSAALILCCFLLYFTH
jgi:hypothetical protein